MLTTLFLTKEQLAWQALVNIKGIHVHRIIDGHGYDICTEESVYKMKRKISVLLVAIVLCFCSGCNNSSETKFHNLDLSETVVIEETPDSGKWSSITFNSLRFSSDTISFVEKAVEKFNGANVDKSEFLYHIRTSGDFYGPNAGGRQELFFTDMTDEIFPKSLSMQYKDENIYVDAFSVLGSVEMYNPKTLAAILGIENNSTWSWKPEISGRVIYTTKLDDENSGCTLDGKEVKINEAVLSAEELLNNGELNNIFPVGMKVEPLKAEVYEFNETKNQCLRIMYQLTYDGIPIEGNSVSAISSQNDKEDGAGEAIRDYPIYVAMFTDNSIDWMRVAPANLKKGWMEINETSINYNYDKACGILSDTLSDEMNFNVVEARLMYAVTANSQDGYNTDSYEISPKWRFHITGIKAQEFSELYVYINADDGLYCITKPY